MLQSLVLYFILAHSTFWQLVLLTHSSDFFSMYLCFCYLFKYNYWKFFEKKKLVIF